MNSCLEIVVGEWHWDRSMTHWQRQLVLCEVRRSSFFFLFLRSQSADQLSLTVKLTVRQPSHYITGPSALYHIIAMTKVNEMSTEKVATNIS